MKKVIGFSEMEEMMSQPEIKRKSRSRARKRQRRQMYLMRTVFCAVLLAAVVGAATVLGSWLGTPNLPVREESQAIQTQTMAEYEK
ncbi:MAG: hypothetical protein Q4E24_14245 [bacterium]|nr:hypothetical protein [bacterium]